MAPTRLALVLILLTSGCKVILGIEDTKQANAAGDGGAVDADPGRSDGGDDTDGGTAPRVTQVAVGFAHTCAVISDGRLFCWGNNADGQLGYGNTDTAPAIGDDEPVDTYGAVDIGGTAEEVAAGNGHTCVLLTGGDVRCWGRNDSGQCGYGTTDVHGVTDIAASAPRVELGGKAVALSAGANHTCARLENGDVLCWGANYTGQLGYGDENSAITGTNVGDDEVPADVGKVPIYSTFHPAVSVEAGFSETCAVVTMNSIPYAKCWGDDSHHQLGYPGGSSSIGDDDTPADWPTVQFTDALPRTIVSGDYHACVLLTSDDIVCWGNNSSGQLGYGNTETIGDDSLEEPDSGGDVSVGGKVAQVVAGKQFTCALLKDSGAVRCWGNPTLFGHLGIQADSPVGDDELPSSVDPVDLGEAATALSTSNGNNSHTCAILGSGALRCWGSNDKGQLGYGNTETIGDGEAPASVDPVAIP